MIILMKMTMILLENYAYSSLKCSGQLKKISQKKTASDRGCVADDVTQIPHAAIQQQRNATLRHKVSEVMLGCQSRICTIESIHYSCYCSYSILHCCKGGVYAGAKLVVALHLGAVQVERRVV